MNLRLSLEYETAFLSSVTMTSSIYADIARENTAFNRLAWKFRYARMDAIEGDEDIEDAFRSGEKMRTATRMPE